MTDDRSTESKQPQLDSTDEEDPRSSLVENGQIWNGVTRRSCRSIDRRFGRGRGRSGETDLLENGDVLTRSPDGINGNE